MPTSQVLALAETSATPKPIERSQDGSIITPYKLHKVEGVLQLPFGWVDDEGTKVDRRLEVHHMTGREEDALALDGDPAEMVTNVVVSCITRLGPITVPYGATRTEDQQKRMIEEYNRLTQPDRFFAMMAVRRVTYGDTYDFVAECPKKGCGSTLQSTSLADYTIVPAVDPLFRKHEVTLPTGLKVSYRIALTGADEERVNNIVKSNPSALLSAVMFARVLTINGQPVVSLTELQAWHAKDRDALRREMQRTDIGYKMDMIESVCPSCKQTLRHPLRFDSGFFLPSSVDRAAWSTAGTTPSS